MMDNFVTNNSLAFAPMDIRCTAGALPVKNNEGKLSIKKVKVHRYVFGKRPNMLPLLVLTWNERAKISVQVQVKIRNEDDTRLKRLTKLERQKEYNMEIRTQRLGKFRRVKLESSDFSEDGKLSNSEIQKHCKVLKQKVLSKKEAEEELIHGQEKEKSLDSLKKSSEYEEYTDSEEETGLRLKPVFVWKKDRITVMEKEKEKMKQNEAKIEAKKMAEETRRQTLKMVEEILKN